MYSQRYTVFKLLFYKNLMVLKRNWKMTLFLEILFPIILFASVLVARDFGLKQSYTIAEKLYSLETKEQLIPKDILYLNVVPDNPFTQKFADNVRKCLKMNLDTLIISRFNTEEDILKEYKVNQTKFESGSIISVIFENRNIDFSTKDLVYKIQKPKLSSTILYNNKLVYRDDVFIKKTVGLQLCLDESFIKMKAKDNLFSILMSTQKLPTPRHRESPMKVDIFRQILCAFFSLAFFFPLCMEILRVYEDKLSRAEVLISLNGIPYSLNILSWLFTSFILSIFYIVPIIIMLHLSAIKNALAVPFFYYGNPIIYWLIMTLHVLHLMIYGLNAFSEFSKNVPNFASFYLFTTMLSIFWPGTDCIFSLLFTIPLGIFLPNMLLPRIFGIINYYESISVGIHWSNLFQMVNPDSGCQGSIGLMLIFSLSGIILYYILWIKDSRRSNKNKKTENFIYESNLREPLAPIKGADTPIIRIRNLKKYYKYNDSYDKMEVIIPEGFSIDCYQGQITVFLDHKNSGKFAIISILTGLISPTQGLVLIDGKNVNDSLDEIIKDIGLCPQENLLFTNLSVAQNLKFFGLLKNRSKSKAAVREDIKTLLQKLRLFEKRNVLPYELSDGQKRKLCLAIALIGDSRILILEEPTAGLDLTCRRDIWDIILEMRERKAILISTQDVEEAYILSDKTVTLRDNNLKVCDSPLSLKMLLVNRNIEESDPQEIHSSICEESCRSVPNFSNEIMNSEKKYSKISQDLKTDNPTKSFKDSIVRIEDNRLVKHSTKALLPEKTIHPWKILETIIFERQLNLVLSISSTLVFILVFMYVHFNWPKLAKNIRLDMYNEPYYSFKHDNESELFGINYKIYAEKFNGKLINHLKEERNYTAALMEFGERYPLEYENKLLAAAKFARDFNTISATALYNDKKSQYAESMSVNLLTNALIKTLIGTDHSIAISFELPNEKVCTLLHDIISKMTIFQCYTAVSYISIHLYVIMACFVTYPKTAIWSDIKLPNFSYWGTIFAFDFIIYLIVMLVSLVYFIIADYLMLGMFGIIEVLIMITLIALFGINILPLVYIFSFAATPIKNIIKLLILLPIAFVSMELIKNILIEFDVIDTSNIYYRVQKELFSLIPYVSFYNAQIAFSKIANTNYACRQISNYFEAEDLCMYNTICCAMNCSNGTCENSLNYYNGFNDNISLEENILRLCISPIFYFILLIILEYKKIQNIYTFDDNEIRISNKIGFEMAKLQKRSKYTQQFTR